MSDPHARKITIDISGQVESFEESCRRAGQALAEKVKRGERELIVQLLHAQQEEKQAMKLTKAAADPTPAPRPASQLSAEASYRARQRGELPRVAWLICKACGARHKGTRHALLCPSCWERLTPDGRQCRTDRVKRHAKRKRSRGVDGKP